MLPGSRLRVRQSTACRGQDPPYILLAEQNKPNTGIETGSSAVCGLIGYTARHEYSLSKQPFRCRVGLPPPVPAAEITAWQTPSPLAPLRVRRAVLSAAYGLPLALPAQQFSAL